MMNAPLIPFKLPTMSYDAESKSFKKGEMLCYIDPSMGSELRWETYFPAQKEALGDYSDYVKKLKGSKGLSGILACLKAVYCLIDFGDNPTTFKDFCSMFSVTSEDYAKQLADSLEKALNLAYPQEKKQSFQN